MSGVKRAVALGLLLMGAWLRCVAAEAAPMPVGPGASEARSGSSPAAAVAATGQARPSHPEARWRLTSGAFLTGHLLRSHSRDLLLRPLGGVADLGFYTYSLLSGAARDLTLDLRSGLSAARATDQHPAGGRPMDLQRWERRLDRLTGRSALSGTVRLLIDGPAFYGRLATEIDAASTSIRFRTYIFDNDDVALGIADRLKSRSRAVPVQVLFDGVGSWGGSQIEAASLPPGHRGPASMADYLSRDSAIDVRVLGNTWLMGDHTKTFIFDDEVAFLGGMNIGREYRHDWHDLMLELSGPVVDELVRDTQQAVAESRWGLLARFRKPGLPARSGTRGAGTSLRLLYTRPGNPEIYRAQVAAIRRARRYVYVENAYLGDDQIVHELIRARQRGVDVRVIVPDRPDSRLISASNTVTLNRLHEAGVRVFLYPGMSHVKAAIYDGWVCMGTANLDRLSLQVNKEINVASSDPALAHALLTELFEPDFAVSTELDGKRPAGVAEHVYERVVDLLL